MGWFEDGDSSSEDETPRATATATNAADDDVDPLDAYMSGVTAEVKAQEEEDRARPMEEEEDDDDDDEEEEEEEDAPRRPTVAASSCAAVGGEGSSWSASTFHRAGEDPGSVRDRRGATDHDHDHDDDDVDSDDDPSAARRTRKIVVAPLPAADHSGVSYVPFQRSFHDGVDRDDPASAAWRATHDVTVDARYAPWTGRYSEEPLSSALGTSLARALSRASIDAPAPVQAQTLPVALAGRDALITAGTGSGKTLAYALPALVHCARNRRPDATGPTALALVPTRELATQVAGVVRRLGKRSGIRAVAVVGGGKGRHALGEEVRRDGGAAFVAATPGRLLDLMSGGRRAPTHVRDVVILILDEADRLLEMGFEPQVRSVLDHVRPDRQTLMLSATFGRRVEASARRWLRDPVRISVGRAGVPTSHVSQHFIHLPSADAKLRWLVEMVPTLTAVGRTLVFVASRVDCDRVARALGDDVEALHGDRHQSDRDAALRRFASGARRVLVATDVAARGLDVPDVVHVVCHDAARDVDAHAHRVGRAGRRRAGADGRARGAAYVLLTDRDADFADALSERLRRGGRDVDDDELERVARQSRRRGRGGRKRTVAGIGWNADDDRCGPAASADAASTDATENARKRSRADD